MRRAVCAPEQVRRVLDVSWRNRPNTRASGEAPRVSAASTRVPRRAGRRRDAAGGRRDDAGGRVDAAEFHAEFDGVEIRRRVAGIGRERPLEGLEGGLRRAAESLAKVVLRLRQLIPDFRIARILARRALQRLETSHEFAVRLGIVDDRHAGAARA